MEKNKLSEMSELSELIKTAQSGDNGAIAALYEEYAKSVFYLALKMLSNKEDAEDITQEVFIHVQQKIGDLKNPETFPAWLNRITVNKCNDFFRKKQVTLNIADEEIAKSDFFEVSEPLLIPDRTFDDAETADIITKIIDGLPLPQKVCIYYYYYQRMTITQIAETLKASESTIKNRLALAREKIRKAIEEIERKDGIKLYGALPLMLTPVLMKSLQNFEMPQSVLDGMFSNITANIANMAGTASTATSSTAGTASTVTTSTAGTASTAATSTAGTASTAAGTAATSTTAATAATSTTAAGTAATASALGIKAIAAAIAGVLAIGGIMTAVLLSGNNESEPEAAPAIVQTEPEPDRNNGAENNNFAMTTTPVTTTTPATTTPEAMTTTPETTTPPETTTESEIATTSSETTTTPADTTATTPPITTAPPATTALSAPTVAIGETIQFGGYDWLVLDVQSDKLFIISKNIQSIRAYHADGGDMTWEHSDIRQYLNGEFYNSFSESDTRIIETTVINGDNPEYGTSGGNDTTDRIFLLSIDETNRYMDYRARIATDAGGVYFDWWLRSPGDAGSKAAFVYGMEGGVAVRGHSIDYIGNYGVRPAMWITLD